jgi:hypothetical protein
MATIEQGITGVFVSLHRPTLRVVIRRKLDVWHDRYDVHKPWEKIDAVVEVLKVFSNEVPDFTKKILAVDERHYRQSSHRTRHYIHTEREKLYGNLRNDLAEKYSRKVCDVWLGTNINTTQMLHVIREACEAAEVEYGSLGSLKM